MKIIYLINIILSYYNLEWDGEKLLYIMDYHGNSKYVVSDSFESVTEFLGIKLPENLHSITTVRDHLDIISSSFRMNYGMIFKYHHKTNYSEDYKTLEFMCRMVDCMFFGKRPPDRFTETLEKLTPWQLSSKHKIGLINAIRENPHKSFTSNKDKFNGKLMMKWVSDVWPGETLKEMKAGFIKYIEEHYNKNFNNFLIEHSHKEVKDVFMLYSNTEFSFKTFELEI